MNNKPASYKKLNTLHWPHALFPLLPILPTLTRHSFPEDNGRPTRSDRRFPVTSVSSVRHSNLNFENIFLNSKFESIFKPAIHFRVIYSVSSCVIKRMHVDFCSVKLSIINLFTISCKNIEKPSTSNASKPSSHSTYNFL